MRPEGVTTPQAGSGWGGVGVALLVATAYVLLLPGPYLAGAYGDDATYVALARALARGAGYRSTWLPGAPIHVQYPPGLPAVLSTGWALGGSVGTVASLARALDILLIATTAGTLWHIARRRLNVAPLPAALFVVGPLFLDSALQYFGLALTEPWFMALWALALLAAYHSGERSGAAALAGAAMGVAALFRAQAAPLVPALALGVALRTRRVRAAGFALVAGLLPIVAWGLLHAAMLRHAAAPASQQSYLADLLSRGALPSALVSNLWFNVRGYVLLFSLYTAFWPLLGVLLVAGFTGLSISGAVRLWRDHPVLVLTCIVNGAVILLWPYNIDRLVVSALPFAGLLAARGAQRAAGGLPRAFRILVWALLLLVAGQVAARQVALRRQGRDEVATGARPAFWTPSWEVPYFDRFIGLTAGWLARQTPRDATVLTPWPVAVWLHAERRVVDPEAVLSPPASDEGEAGAAAVIAGMIVRDSVGYVVVGHPDQRVSRGMRALRTRCAEAVSRVYEAPPYGLPEVYRVDAGSACLSAAAGPPGGTR